MNRVQAAAGAIWTAVEGLLAVGTLSVAPVAIPGLPAWAAGAGGVVLAVGVFAAKSLAVSAEVRSLADRVRAGVDTVDDALDKAVPAPAPVVAAPVAAAPVAAAPVAAAPVTAPPTA